MILKPVRTTRDHVSSAVLLDQGRVVVLGSRDTGALYQPTLVCYEENGNFCDDFGHRGIAEADTDDSSIGIAVARQPDGKFVVAGFSGPEDATQITVTRFAANGAVDREFGKDGVAIASIGASSYGEALALQSDGKIVVTGTALNPDRQFAVARFNTDGTLDATFGSGGWVTTKVADGEVKGHGAAVQPDGKILAAGFSDDEDQNQGQIILVRYNSNGSVDRQFGIQGCVTTKVGGQAKAFALALQVDGKILVGGSGDGASLRSSFALVRYESNGALDASFGKGGIALSTVGKGLESIRSIAIADDGKTLATGLAFDNVHGDTVLMRYDAHGVPDTDFGTLDTARPSIVARFPEEPAILWQTATLLEPGQPVAGGYAGATLAVHRVEPNPADRFTGAGRLSPLVEGGGFSLDGQLIGDVVRNFGGQLVLRFNAAATTALVTKTIQSVAYSYAGTDRPPSRMIGFELSIHRAAVKGGAVKLYGLAKIFP